VSFLQSTESSFATASGRSLAARNWRTMRLRAGSECGAHREPLGARSGAGEQEAREVDADDEENEPDRSPEDDERTAQALGDEFFES
jgi:hypothetical protein